MLNKIYQSQNLDWSDCKHYLFGECIRVRDGGEVLQLEIGKNHGYESDGYQRTWGYYSNDCKPILKGG